MEGSGCWPRFLALGKQLLRCVDKDAIEAVGRDCKVKTTEQLLFTS